MTPSAGRPASGRPASTRPAAAHAARPAPAPPESGPTEIVRNPPAKLNLTLAVTHRRQDGYHALHSIMVPLALCDSLTVSVMPPQARPGRRPSGPAVADSINVSGFDAGEPTDNLVLRAIAQARQAVRETWPGAPGEPPPLEVKLRKRIPVAAGLGGGSSDAACAVDAALEAWDTGLSYEKAAELTASLGSDVPFFLAGGAALVTGRGELVEPLPDLTGKTPAVLLVTPRVQLSTARIFAAYSHGARLPAWGAARVVSEEIAEAMRHGLAAHKLLERAADLASSNDLLLAALIAAPPLLQFRRALARLLGCPLGQSGSGPTTWALYPSLAAARKAADLVSAAIRDGALPAVGEGEPFVVATTILLRGDAGHLADHAASDRAPEAAALTPTDWGAHNVTDAASDPLDPEGR